MNKTKLILNWKFCGWKPVKRGCLQHYTQLRQLRKFIYWTSYCTFFILCLHIRDSLGYKDQWWSKLQPESNVFDYYMFWGWVHFLWLNGTSSTVFRFFFSKFYLEKLLFFGCHKHCFCQWNINRKKTSPRIVILKLWKKNVVVICWWWYVDIFDLHTRRRKVFRCLIESFQSNACEWIYSIRLFLMKFAVSVHSDTKSCRCVEARNTIANFELKNYGKQSHFLLLQRRSRSSEIYRNRYDYLR